MFINQARVFALLFCAICTSLSAESWHKPDKTPAGTSAQLGESLDRGRELDSKSKKVESELKTVEAKLEEAKNQDLNASESERLHEALVKAQLDLSFLRVRFTEEYPGVIRARQKVAELQTSYDELVASGGGTRSSTVADLSRQLAALKLEQVQLQEELERNRRETASLLMKHDSPRKSRSRNGARTLLNR